MDAQTAVQALHACLDKLALGPGLQAGSVREQHLCFGSSSYGWGAGDLHSALEASQIALTACSSPEHWASSQNSGTAASRHGSADDASIADALACST